MNTSTHYDQVSDAIGFLVAHADEQPSLERVAGSVGLSGPHFQRIFSEYTGVSPKQFLQHLTLERAKDLLRDGASVLEGAHAVGLSGPARLHDHFVVLEAMTPGEFKRGGEGLSMRLGVHATPFGTIGIALTERGICALEFLDGTSEAFASALHDRWPSARIERDGGATRKEADRLFDLRAARPLVHLHVNGTNFRVHVWEALLRIPAGSVQSYDAVARSIGKPKAARAVGNAIAANPVAFLIPCHRVILGSGAVGNYRWGPLRKRALLAWEAARQARSADATAQKSVSQ
jgi:AraC family transcriptional regulator, regulatory protein of adaptative response / methylated-DNA-[protein]-cysteine methyltransferase